MAGVDCPDDGFVLLKFEVMSSRRGGLRCHMYCISGVTASLAADDKTCTLQCPIGCVGASFVREAETA